MASPRVASQASPVRPRLTGVLRALFAVPVFLIGGSRAIAESESVTGELVRSYAERYPAVAARIASSGTAEDIDAATRGLLRSASIVAEDFATSRTILVELRLDDRQRVYHLVRYPDRRTVYRLADLLESRFVMVTGSRATLGYGGSEVHSSGDVETLVLPEGTRLDLSSRMPWLTGPHGNTLLAHCEDELVRSALEEVHQAAEGAPLRDRTLGIESALKGRASSAFDVLRSKGFDGLRRVAGMTWLPLEGGGSVMSSVDEGLIRFGRKSEGMAFSGRYEVVLSPSMRLHVATSSCTADWKAAWLVDE